MIYGDLGITPIAIDIKSRVVSYWSKLISMHDQPTRTSYLMLYIYITCIKIKSANQITLKTLNIF